MNEAADSVWSTRQMDRQISTLYYERLLASREKESVVAEAQEKLKDVAPSQFIHDPFVLEFLDLKDYPRYPTESRTGWEARQDRVRAS